MVTFNVNDLKDMNARIGIFSDFLRSENVCDDDIFASKLVSSELIANVILHGGESAHFLGELFPDAIRITVTSPNQKDISLLTSLPDVFAERGRGLYIIRCFGEIERIKEGLRVLIKLHI